MITTTFAGQILGVKGRASNTDLRNSIDFSQAIYSEKVYLDKQKMKRTFFVVELVALLLKAV